MFTQLTHNCDLYTCLCLYLITNTNKSCVDLLSEIHFRPQGAAHVLEGPCSLPLSAPEMLLAQLRDRDCFLGIRRTLLVALPN